LAFVQSSLSEKEHDKAKTIKSKLGLIYNEISKDDLSNLDEAINLENDFLN